MEMQPLVTDLESDLAFDHVEPLLLVEVEVQVRAAGLHLLVLHEEEPASGFSAGDFEVEGAETQRMRFAQAVLSWANDVQSVGDGRCRIVDVCLGEKKVGKSDCGHG